MQEVIFKDLGLKSYIEAFNYQEELHKNIVLQKTNSENFTNHYLLFVEHPHVYTLGKNGLDTNLLLNTNELEQKGIQFIHTNRGGDITYHGPGQLVCYPIFNLPQLKIGVKDYIYYLEESIISLSKSYGIPTHRVDEATGVWTNKNDGLPDKKICAIGVRVSRGVTMHGLALNVNTDLSFFNFINPCGYTTNNATSIKKETTSKTIDIDEVKNKLKVIFAQQFNIYFD